MNKKVYEILEFNKILKQLASKSCTPLGKEKCLDLHVVTNIKKAKDLQEETREAITSIRLLGELSLHGLVDIRPYLKRAGKHGQLNVLELFEILKSLKIAQRAQIYCNNLTEHSSEVYVLITYLNKIEINNELISTLEKSISEGGEILDSASQLLSQYRKSIIGTENNIRKQIDRLLKSNSVQKMLSDTLVTVRNERFVLPVRQEYRNQFSGIIHDQSASGQTLFIEPQGIVTLNNELQSTKFKIESEIKRILIELTEAVKQCSDLLWDNLKILSELDFIFAKAKFGYDLQGELPDLNDHGIVDLKNAWHPLLNKDIAVKNRLTIDNETNLVVITGPNTGGKTVTLKTIGLCTLMALAGLPISAGENSKIAVFKQILADIGEEQSIEHNLSTFSAHMVNLVSILKKLDSTSLVLYDELGSGTDPKEGATLAMAILDESIARGAKIAATTHYSELKAYAYNRKGVVNASVKFDLETLSPTYKVLMGVPGKSNAFAISRKLGLSEKIIDNAKGMLESEIHNVENMIYTLEQEKERAVSLRKQVEILKIQTRQTKEQLEKERSIFQAEKDNLLNEAKQEAVIIIEKAKCETEKIIRELNEAKEDVSKQEIVSVENINEKLKILKPKIEPKITKNIKNIQSNADEVFHNGDEVRVISMGQTGIIIKEKGNKFWIVQVGIMKITLPGSDLQKVVTKKSNHKPAYIITKSGNNNLGSNELDLRGVRYEEALLKTERFIDQALLTNYGIVSIIHGYGTGALRKGVRSFLEKHSAIKSIRFGGQGEGGMGVTIVELK